MDYYDYSTSTYAASSDVGAVAVVIWHLNCNGSFHTNDYRHVANLHQGW